jgi:hypothetical protein
MSILAAKTFNAETLRALRRVNIRVSFLTPAAKTRRREGWGMVEFMGVLSFCCLVGFNGRERTHRTQRIFYREIMESMEIIFLKPS